MAKRRRAKKRRSNRGGTRLPGFVWAGLIVLGLLILWVAVDLRALPDVGDLATKNPTTTALIEQRAEEARDEGKKPRRSQRWVGLAQVSKHAIDAVLLSEDAAFFQHDGVDMREMRKALTDAWEKRALGRGASTLTMQLAKNLWLSGDRSLWRKAKEIILTRRLEDALPKKRILTLYLNIAEWGDGVYGIDAAARAHFGVSAVELSPAQSVVLASLLPAPRTWSPRKPTKRLVGKSTRLLERMAQAGRLTSSEAAFARIELANILGTAKPGSGTPDDDSKPGTLKDAFEEVEASLEESDQRQDDATRARTVTPSVPGEERHLEPSVVPSTGEPDGAPSPPGNTASEPSGADGVGADDAS